MRKGNILVAGGWTGIGMNAVGRAAAETRGVKEEDAEGMSAGWRVTTDTGLEEEDAEVTSVAERAAVETGKEEEDTKVTSATGRTVVETGLEKEDTEARSMTEKGLEQALEEACNFLEVNMQKLLYKHLVT
ncbi:hypothetical protein NDU88_006018 [Pleurodeles waltl]|uniref:Uncharacterized protein n=1 Tax=Pleurodeles waltl TaxID=8319 RepID=A0AAV7TVX7_PLEWA|nr:hypothetical protein NDU88_006018 [Pleurodeles waltl]